MKREANHPSRVATRLVGLEGEYTTAINWGFFIPAQNAIVLRVLYR